MVVLGANYPTERIGGLVMLKLPPPEDDGLYIQPVKEWSRHKHHFLRRYIDAFATAMRDKSWASLHYIDLFAGAGIERLRESGTLAWGSPLIAAQAKHAFHALHACEKNWRKWKALRTRLERFQARCEVECLRGDANVLVHQVVQSVPQGSLSLAFLDPTGLHLDYDTLRALGDRRADLLIFFPDRLDVLRNWRAYYFDNPRSNLDRVLGPGSAWRKIGANHARSRWAEAFRDLYITQIRKLGYTEFDFERIPTSGRPMYWLIFCSKSPAGTKIWRGIARRKPDGQGRFDFA